MKKALLFVLLFAMLLSLAACGNKGNGGETTENQTVAGTVEEKYPYPEVGYDGYEFKILNTDSFEAYAPIVVTEDTSDLIQMAKFRVCQVVEENMDIVIKEKLDTDMRASAEKIKVQQSGNLHEFDMALAWCAQTPALLTDGYLADLSTIKTMSLDAPYWDATVNDELTINGRMLVATSPLNLYAYSFTEVVVFNETMMSAKGLEYPYRLARDKQWTLEKLGEYAEAGASLNGDASFSNYNPDTSKLVYGITGLKLTPFLFFSGFGVDFVDQTSEGELVINVESQDIQNMADALCQYLSNENGSVWYDSTSTKWNEAFYRENAMMVVFDIKMTLNAGLKNMESAWGIVPMPLYNTSQQDYVSPFTNGGLISITSNLSEEAKERAGAIVDALSYESNRMVLPAYFDEAVSYHGLRNENSLEMLQIVRRTRKVDIGYLMGITVDFNHEISTMIAKGGSGFSGSVDRNAGVLKDKLTIVIAAYNENN